VQVTPAQGSTVVVVVYTVVAAVVGVVVVAAVVGVVVVAAVVGVVVVAAVVGVVVVAAVVGVVVLIVGGVVVGELLLTHTPPIQFCPEGHGQS